MGVYGGFDGGLGTGLPKPPPPPFGPPPSNGAQKEYTRTSPSGSIAALSKKNSKFAQRATGGKVWKTGELLLVVVSSVPGM